MLLSCGLLLSAVRAGAYGIGTNTVHWYDMCERDQVPVHQLITLEGLLTWEDRPGEFATHTGNIDSTDQTCELGWMRFNSTDGLMNGAKEEDEDFTAVPFIGCRKTIGADESCPTRASLAACGPGDEGCTWPNALVEHFWNPDLPLASGFDCGTLAGGYNQGLSSVPPALIPHDGSHYDSSYRLAQFYWDHIVLPHHWQGTDDGEARAYYWLGRIAHLLEDLTVPAHVHDDMHGFTTNCDSYEDSFKTVDSANDITEYRGSDYAGEEYQVDWLPNLEFFDWTSVHPYSTPPPLFKLFWFTAQRTQYFWSDDATGEGYYVNLLGQRRDFPINLWIGEGFSDTSVEDLASHLIPHALKAVGGLYRLFWDATHPPWTSLPPATVTSGQPFSVSWRIIDGHDFGHTNVHLDTISDLRPATCLGRSSCQNTSPQAGGVGTFSATITAPQVTSLTSYYLATHTEIAGFDVLGEVIPIQVAPPTTSHTLTITAGPAATPNQASPNGQIAWSVSATDSSGHSLSYDWTASCSGLASAGSFDQPRARTPTWTAPVNATGVARTCTIGVTVVDGAGLSRTKQATIVVQAAAPTHAIQIASAAAGGPNPVLSRATVQLGVAAVDSLGHELGYAWSAACPTLPTSGDFTGSATRTPTWLAPANASATEQTCTISVVVSDGLGIQQTSSYQQRVSPGGAASLSIVGGIQFLEPPPYPINGKTTVDATIKNVGTTTLQIDRIHATATFVDGFGSSYSRDWPADSFSPPLVLGPGATQRYARLMSETLPGLAVTGAALIQVKFFNTPGTQVVSNAEAGARAQLAFEVGHEVMVTNAPGASPSTLGSGATATMNVNALDSLRHAIVYRWSAACPWAASNGWLSDPAAWQPSWTAPVNTTGMTQSCTLRVEVSDAFGATDDASVAVPVESIAHTLVINGTPSSSANPVGPGDTVTLAAAATDSLDHGLTFAWSASCPALEGNGRFSNAAQQSPLWTAPDNATGLTQSCTISVTVDDTRGLLRSAQLVQQVTSREHAIVLASAPIGEPNPVGSSGETFLGVDVADSLGHDLHYEWRATCTDLDSDGSFADGDTAAPIWTAPANPSDTWHECLISVTVSDGVGMKRTWSYQQVVEPAPAPSPSPSPTVRPTATPTAQPLTPTPQATTSPTASPTARPTPTALSTPMVSPPTPTGSATPIVTNSPGPTPTTGTTPAAPARRTADDYDGDGKADPALYDRATGTWFVLRSRDGVLTVPSFGGPDFDPVPADYDGDRRCDIAVYSRSTGYWYIVQSKRGFREVASFGGPGFVPVPADYDGDRKADVAVYQSTTGLWRIQRSKKGLHETVLGGPGLQPVPGNYDGDRKSDVAVYEKAAGRWTVAGSRVGPWLIEGVGGSAKLVAAAGDFDGDGATDAAVYHKKKGSWRYRGSTSGDVALGSLGGGRAVSVVADYDGDGASDPATYEAATGRWRYLGSTAGAGEVLFGGPAFAPASASTP